MLDKSEPSGPEAKWTSLKLEYFQIDRLIVIAMMPILSDCKVCFDIEIVYEDG